MYDTYAEDGAEFAGGPEESTFESSYLHMQPKSEVPYRPIENDEAQENKIFRMLTSIKIAFTNKSDDND